MKQRFYIAALLLIFAVAFAEARPRIVVNVVVSGLNQNDLSRYESKFGKDGFLRLSGAGATFTECYANYAPTTPEAGLATVATGVEPSVHGVVSSTVFDRTLNKFSTLCHKSGNEASRTSANSKLEGGYTTQHFTAQTLSEVVLASSKNNRAITIAHTPVSAMILTGRQGECYWINNAGKWSSADCYTNTLPTWVYKCNSDDMNHIFATDVWYGRYVRENYLNTTATDITVYDKNNAKRQRSQRKASDGWVNKLLSTPSGNLAIFEFAKRAVTSLAPLKSNDGTTMLTICLDVPRIIAEKYGPDSIEYEDMLYSLDASLGEFLTFLYAQYPNFSDAVVLLTSDGGVSPSERTNSDATRFNMRQFEIIMNAFLSARYGQDSWVLGYANGSLYLNHDVIFKHKKDVTHIQNEVASFALQYRGVLMATTATAMRSAQFSHGALGVMQNGYNPRRSGDVLITLEAGRIEMDPKRVAMSGSSFGYDRHIPLIIYGGDIAPQRISERVTSDRIASTLSEIIGVNRPQCSTSEYLKMERRR